MTTTAETQVVVSLTVDEITSIYELILAYISKPQCRASSSAMEMAAALHALEKLKTAAATMSFE